MIGAQPAPAHAVDPELDGIAGLQHPMRHGAEVDEQIPGLLDGVAHCDFGAGCRKDCSGVADLAARFRIERRLIEDHRDLVAGGRLGNPLRRRA